MPQKVLIDGVPAKLHSEQETRKNILEIAAELGCEGDVKQIFAKYDLLLLKCTNDQEKYAISVAGNEELHFLLSSKPDYVVVMEARRTLQGQIITRNQTKIGKE